MTVPAKAKYTYFFTDLISNNFTGRLPLTNVSAQTSLAAPGSFSADLNLSDKMWRDSAVVTDIVTPKRTAYWVDRDGQLIAGGIVWDDDYDSSTRTYTITGATFDSFADHQIVQALLVYADLDICTIAINLWNHLQSRDNADIGLTIPTVGSVLSGSIDSLAIDPSQVTTYGSAISGVSKQTPGFDYYVSVGYNTDGTPGKNLVLGGPYVGAPPSSTGLVFRRPGNVLNYKWPRFGSQSPNQLIGIGGGVGTGALQSIYTDAAEIGAGFPLVQDTVSYKTIFDQSSLDKITAGYGSAVSRGVVTPTIQLSPNRTDVSLGSIRVGDPCRVIFEPDEYFPQGLDTYMRISTININPSDTGQMENAVLTLTSSVT